MKRALALALTGDSVPAHEAQAMGLVYRVFPDADFMSEVRAFTERLAGYSPEACRLIKQGLRKSLENDLGKQLKVEAELQRQAGTMRVFREAITAFLAKRQSAAEDRRRT